MTTDFEHVLRVTEYYDGLREGEALFNGRPHHFRNLGWLDGEGDPSEERFELRPVNQPNASAILVRAEFRNSATAPDPCCPPLVPQEVRWSPLHTP